jgi:hypothetical protein
MDYQTAKSLSKNEWKPIHELNILRLFSIFYPDKNNPRFNLEPARNDSEDGVLIDIISGYYHPAELVKVTTEEREVENSKLLKKTAISTPRELLGIDVVLKTINRKATKYSDTHERILIVDVSECIPLSWDDKWSPVITHCLLTNFFAIYAVQCISEPKITVLK